MSNLVLTKTKMRQGVWEGVLTGSGSTEPGLEITHLGEVVPDTTLTHNADQDHWVLNIPVPANAISDGAQTILIQEAASGDQLGSVTLIAGEALGDDVRAEMDLLRAELDMLKRAFRRHCLETS